MVQDVPKIFKSVKMVQKSPKSSKIIKKVQNFRNFPKWFKIVPNGPKGFTISNMVQKGPTWISSYVFQMGPTCKPADH